MVCTMEMDRMEGIMMQKSMRRKFVYKENIKRILLLVMILLTCMTTIFAQPQVVQAATLSPSKYPDKNKVYDLVKVYDPDVYHILKTQEKNGDDFMAWYPGKNMEFVANFEAAVHETYHGYLHSTAKSGCENVYAGGGVGYQPSRKSVSYFKTEEMAKHIPQKLRTFRYADYVSEGSRLTANQYGMHGLMDEFSAYYWGLQVSSALMGYYKEHGADSLVWGSYAKNLGNGMNAYAEFKYWILNYMIYAKKNHKSVYNAILKDTAMCNAYTAIETQYAALIKENTDQFLALNDEVSQYGYKIIWDERGMYGCGSGTKVDDYNLLMKELKKSDFVAMDKELKKHAKDATAKMTISKTRAELAAGSSTTLKLNNNKKKITWSSSNKKVATVNANGKVTGKSKGVCTIQGKVGSRIFYCTLNVGSPVDKSKEKTSAEVQKQIEKAMANKGLRTVKTAYDNGEFGWDESYEELVNSLLEYNKPYSTIKAETSGIPASRLNTIVDSLYPAFKTYADGMYLMVFREKVGNYYYYDLYM